MRDHQLDILGQSTTSLIKALAPSLPSGDVAIWTLQWLRVSILRPISRDNMPNRRFRAVICVGSARSSAIE